jgi:hypothetical protein
MNIKGLVRNLSPFAKPSEKATAKEVAESKRVETGSASDRDANGKQEQAGEEQQKRPLTQEDIDQAIAHLKSLQGVKDNNLSVECKMDDGITVIYVKDHIGKVVRRLAEPDIWYVLKTRANPEQKKSGQLLNKSA